MQLSADHKEHFRQKLCQLERFILEAILKERTKHTTDQLAAVSEETAADVIYAIVQIADRAIHTWCKANWPSEWPVEIVMEGVEDDETLTFPPETDIAQTRLKCIIDPIDGTRGIMYDKRSAWILAGLAPQRFADNNLADIEVAAMTEIPTTKQWRADQFSAIRGGGCTVTGYNILNAFSEVPVSLQPSQARDVRHAFGTISRFFPEGSSLLSRIEEHLWNELYGSTESGTPLIFNDHYISTGGQFYEILSGHDRFIADLRPEAFRKLGFEAKLCCHPYDVACVLILEEAGCILLQPDGQPLNCPLDTTTPISWAAYANKELADAIQPALQKVLGNLTT